MMKIWVFPKIGLPPNHPFLIGFSIINHPFWGTTIFGNTHMYNPGSQSGWKCPFWHLLSFARTKKIPSFCSRNFHDEIPSTHFRTEEIKRNSTLAWCARFGKEIFQQSKRKLQQGRKEHTPGRLNQLFMVWQSFHIGIFYFRDVPRVCWNFVNDPDFGENWVRILDIAITIYTYIHLEHNLPSNQIQCVGVSHRWVGGGPNHLKMIHLE